MYRILIADDAAVIRSRLRNILEANGYQIAGEAANGREAVEKYDLLRPHLVTMDITMPLIDGVQALIQIREIDSDAKVVMLSAMQHREWIMKAIQAGACDFVVKPFTEQRLLSAVQKQLTVFSTVEK